MNDIIAIELTLTTSYQRLSSTHLVCSGRLHVEGTPEGTVTVRGRNPAGEAADVLLESDADFKKIDLYDMEIKSTTESGKVSFMGYSDVKG